LGILEDKQFVKQVAIYVRRHRKNS
jgi:hypothetical protein